MPGRRCGWSVAWQKMALCSDLVLPYRGGRDNSGTQARCIGLGQATGTTLARKLNQLWCESSSDLRAIFGNDRNSCPASAVPLYVAERARNGEFADVNVAAHKIAEIVFEHLGLHDSRLLIQLGCAKGRNCN